MSELGHARHRARQRALELLYESHIKGRSTLDVVAEQAVRPDEFVRSLLDNVSKFRGRAEALISANSHQWSMERIAVIDRLIMTLALCELFGDDAPPVAVVLDEAVELAKVFSTDDSPGFVNGVLSGCVAQLANPTDRDEVERN